jgi:hypothetical protein
MCTLVRLLALFGVDETRDKQMQKRAETGETNFGANAQNNVCSKQADAVLETRPGRSLTPTDEQNLNELELIKSVKTH